MKLLFCSDTEKTLYGYRRDLISRFRNSSAGWWFGGTAFFQIFRASVVVSSNLRSNILVCLFLWKRAVIILNGLGRFESSRFLRFVIIALIKLSFSRKILIAQSYRDYRYFRKFVARVAWIPGSGGVSYERGKSDRGLVVSRDDKLALVSESLNRFYKDYGIPLDVVGCTVDNSKLHGVPHAMLGYFEDPKDIYAVSNVFVQPDGYGEGVPHSMVCAICSGLDVFISKRVFIKSGFYKLLNKAELVPGKAGWQLLRYQDVGALSQRLGIDSINREYARVIELVIGECK